MHAGLGMDHGQVLVRKLGAADREDKNEVWAGEVVNSAAKLAGREKQDSLYASARAYEVLQGATGVRRRCLFESCGCDPELGVDGLGFDAKPGQTKVLWVPEPLIADDVEGEQVWRLGNRWCPVHGPEFCEAIITGKCP